MGGLFVPFKPKGRPPKYSPKKLLDAFEGYLRDREANPIIVERVCEGGNSGASSYQKAKELERLHPLSIADFCVYLGCSRNWWNELSDEFLGVKGQIETYIQSYQLKGASIGMFNANIVSRLLGLADKQEVTENVVYQMKDPNE